MAAPRRLTPARRDPSTPTQQRKDMERDLELSMKPVVGLTSAVYASSPTTGTGIEVGSFETVYLLVEPTVLGTTVAVGLQTSDELASGYTTVAGSAIAINDGQNGNRSILRGHRTSSLRKYVRVVASFTPGSPLFGVTLLFFNPKRGEEQTVVYQARVG